MATLKISRTHAQAVAAAAHERVVCLRDWLDGDWAAVCSDPDDFAPPRGTPAGFVTCIAQELCACGVKLIAFDQGADPPRSNWLDHAVNDDALVLLERADACIRDLAECALAAKLVSLTRPFVIIVDARGRIRTTLEYRSHERGRSLAEILQVISALREGNGAVGSCGAGARRTTVATACAYRDFFSS